jgi:uncharacterized protein
MDKLIKNKLVQLKPIFQSHKVVKAYIFGSVLSEKFNSESDIDFLITFRPELDPLEKGELWWSLYDALRDFFNREIDLIAENSLKNPYFIQEINQTKELIYG